MRFLINDTKRFDLHFRHAGVGDDARAVETFLLPIPCALNAFSNNGGRFPFFFSGQSAVFNGRHLDVQINAVQQRAGYFRLILANLLRRTPAGARPIAKIAAGTGIHGGHQHEFCRKTNAHGRPRNGDGSLLQRLTKRFQRVSFEFRQFVQKKHTQVSQADFAGMRHLAATHQADIGNGVMRRPERPHSNKSLSRTQLTGHGKHFGDFDRLFKGKIRQNRGQALGEHAFTRTGWPDHQNVMAARRGDFQRPQSLLLALDF